jgi:hypothetical protein
MAVQIRTTSLRHDGSARELLENCLKDCRIANALAKEFLDDANANQELCIALKANGHNASLVAEIDAE